jgi:hypothetical protein
VRVDVSLTSSPPSESTLIAHAQSERPRRFSWPVLAMLLALVAFSGVAHLSALHRDLPLQEPDESAFVRPAVRIAATGDLNPQWFGHPGSTVIYPVAGLIRGWETIANGGPIVGSDGFGPSPCL